MEIRKIKRFDIDRSPEKWEADRRSGEDGRMNTRMKPQISLFGGKKREIGMRGKENK